MTYGNAFKFWFLDAMVSDLSPHDMCEDDTNERLGKVSSALERRLRRLQEEVKARKFRYKPELLDEKLLSCSQFSVLQSQELSAEELSQSFSQHSLQEESTRPSTYR